MTKHNSGYTELINSPDSDLEDFKTRILDTDTYHIASVIANIHEILYHYPDHLYLIKYKSTARGRVVSHETSSVYVSDMYSVNPTLHFVFGGGFTGGIHIKDIISFEPILSFDIGFV